MGRHGSGSLESSLTAESLRTNRASSCQDQESKEDGDRDAAETATDRAESDIVGGITLVRRHVAQSTSGGPGPVCSRATSIWGLRTAQLTSTVPPTTPVTMLIVASPTRCRPALRHLHRAAARPSQRWCRARP